MSESPKVASHADLQQRALVALNGPPPDTVAELARRLDAERPSVSRAIHALADLGLVEQAGRQWRLTPAGSAAVEEVTALRAAKMAAFGQEVERVREQHERMARVIARTIEPAMHDMALRQAETLRHVTAALGPDPQVMRELTSAVLEQFRSATEPLSALRIMDTTALAGLADQMRVPPVVFEGLSDILSGVRYSEALRAALDTQQLHVKFTEWLPKLEMPWLTELVTSSLLPTSQIVTDLSGIRTALAAAEASVRPRLIPALAAATEITAAHRAYARDMLPQGRPRSSRAPGGWSPKRAERDVVMPSFTTSRFVGATRRVVELTLDGVGSHPLRDPQERESVFVASLERLGGPLVTLWHLAWYELTSAGPDPMRMAAHAGRELLAQALELLAPDSLLPDKSRAEITRQMRVDAIAGKGSESRRDWARATARHLTETYAFLSAEAHRRDALPRYDEHVAAGVLESTAGLIRVLIACAEERHSGGEPEEV